MCVNDWGKMVVHLILGLCLVLGFGVGNSWGQDFSAAVFYGANPPWDELKAFDVVVVEPEHGFHPEAYRTSTSELFAYVSLGEVLPSRVYAQNIPEAWIIGENKAWGSKIVDQTQEEWAKFILTNIVDPLWRQGYRGFFLDTLDSYHMVQQDEAFQQAQQNGLIKVIRTIKQKYPEVKLIFNRGFELVPNVHQEIFALAVESLFQGWNPSIKQFVPVSQRARDWLLGKLGSFQQDYNLPVIVIDYLPPERRTEARAVARKIQELGFIPWVTTPELDALGVGTREVIPRKVLLLYDGRQHPDVTLSEIHRFIDFPLQHLGLVPQHWDIRQGFPENTVGGRYAGIVVWMAGLEAPLAEALHQWISRQILQQVKVVFLETFGFPFRNDLLQLFEIDVGAQSRGLERIQVRSLDPIIGLEFPPFADRQHFFPFHNRGGTSLLQLVQGKNVIQDAVGLSWWGGYALRPFPVVAMPEGRGNRWVFDPIQFLQRALQVVPIPIPETTTRFGRRLILAHVDGDGFPSRVEFAHPSSEIEYAGEMLLDDILRHYTIPTTVSIIEGEIGGTGLYPKLSPRLEHAAKHIFGLTHVEIASHSYSHPFAWQSAYTQGVKQPHLPIPGYAFAPDQVPREIEGSIDYIDQHLAPPNKSTKVFLWTGDCNPSDEALKLVHDRGLANMNGGDTTITKQNHSLTAVAPLGIQKGPYLQVYAPNQNENMYTNLWKGPFYGYQQVIETFQLTERPRRYKPINIYYHTYSASKQASLAALHKVYDWALAQPVNPIFVSEYVQLVKDFSRMVVTRSKDGWEMRNLANTTELRVSQSMGFPDLEASRGVLGYVDHGNERYVHVDPSRSPFLVMTSKPPARPFLVSTNGSILKWNRMETGVEVMLKGYRPLTSVIGNVTTCEVLEGPPLIEHKLEGSNLLLRFGEGQDHVASIVCG